jgi:hypothetical protein
MPPFLSSQSNGVRLALKVQPRARKDEIVGVHGAQLRVKVKAPPVDAAANEAVLKLLAKTLRCPAANITLVHGHAAHHKVVRIVGLSSAAVEARLGV